MSVFSDRVLRGVGSEIFEAAGAPRDEARLVADLLVEANLTGHDSHGVIRIPLYIERIRKGRVKPGAKTSLVRETPSTAVIDGNWGFGQVVAKEAMEIAIEKAKGTCIGSAGVLHCNHIGRLNFYSEMALKQDMIGITMCNSSPLVAPFGGKEPLLSTNPVCFAVPAGEERPFVLDMATSVCARGKIRVKIARGEKCPEGWILTREGHPTTDPAEVLNGGVILPFGGAVGYKGYGLSLLVDMMSGALTGAGCTSSEEYRSRPHYGGNGTFLMAINIAGYTDVDLFKERVDSLIRTIRASSVAPGHGEILIPGEPEARTRERRLREGIFVEDKTWNAIKKTAEEYQVDIQKTVG